MKLIMEQWQQFVESDEPSPELQTILDQLDSLSLGDINTLWRAVVAAHKQKQNEIKAGFKKGDKVEFDYNGETITGTVVHRGAKFVSVNVDGWSKPWKRNPSDLKKIV